MYRAVWKQIEVAVKKIILISNAAIREMETMKSVKHRNIVAFLGACQISDKELWLVLELAVTSLDRHLKTLLPNEESSLDWAQQVGKGMRYLHFEAPEEIIHGDLKSPNVLVYPGGLLKIGDFGSSKFKIGQQSSVTRVTVEWTAPELFDSGKHSMESDVYAYGILLWEMVTHEIPYKQLSHQQILSKVNKNERPIIPSSCNEFLRNVMEECWDMEPKVFNNLFHHTIHLLIFKKGVFNFQ